MGGSALNYIYVYRVLKIEHRVLKIEHRVLKIEHKKKDGKEEVHALTVKHITNLTTKSMNNEFRHSTQRAYPCI